MDKRTALALFLCGLMTVAYIWYVNTHRPQPTAPISETEGENPAPPADPVGDPSTSSEVPPTIESGTPTPVTKAVPARDDIILQGEDLLYDATFTNRGASILNTQLTKYKQTLEEDDRFTLLQAVEDDFFERKLTDPTLEDKNRPSFKHAEKFVPYRSLLLRDPTGTLPLDTTNYEVLEESPDRVVFAATMPNGIRVTKEFISQPDEYNMQVRFTFKNESEITQSMRCEVVAAARVMPEGGSNVNIVGAAGFGENGSIATERVKATARKLRNTGEVIVSKSDKPIAWVGSSDRYFAAVLIPITSQDATDPLENVSYAAFRYLPETDFITSKTGGTSITSNVSASLGLPPITLTPNEEVTKEFTYFMGPKTRDVLEKYSGLNGILDYGWFAPISRILLSLLGFFYKLIPNYGVGIILLTVLVKVCLHPLTKKGQISMHRMQKLQPFIRELQEKYKHDKQRLSQEQMKLFRDHGANPMTGCMPLFFQFPVLIGLFRMLQNSVEIRHEKFLFWVTDLSSPDTITHIFSYPLNILPILMVFSWLAQQAMMPKPTDPQQAQTQKMMKFMPVVFGFICYSMPSGLVLYWLTSTFLGIIEQKIIKFEIARMDEQGKFPKVEVEVPTRSKNPRNPKRK